MQRIVDDKSSLVVGHAQKVHSARLAALTTALSVQSSIVGEVFDLTPAEIDNEPDEVALLPGGLAGSPRHAPLHLDAVRSLVIGPQILELLAPHWPLLERVFAVYASRNQVW